MSHTKTFYGKAFTHFLFPIIFIGIMVSLCFSNAQAFLSFDIAFIVTLTVYYIDKIINS